MAALLRVLGFVPALVHLAWAQVALAEGGQTSSQQLKWVTPWRIGVGAFVCVIVLGLSCALALNQQWLAPKWQGAWIYIGPLVLWQGSACMSAAFSHRPFQTQAAHQYSWVCMCLASLQALILLGPICFGLLVEAEQHMTVFAICSSLGLICLTRWTAKLR